MNRYYHFTSEVALADILKQGVLLPGDSHIGSSHEAMLPMGERLGPDVVWLLDDPVRPVNKASDPRNHGLFGTVIDKTAIRITVNVLAVSWLKWLPAEAMNPLWRDMLIQAGGGKDAARHWFVHPAPILARRFVAVERVDGKQFTEGEPGFGWANPDG